MKISELDSTHVNIADIVAIVAQCDDNTTRRIQLVDILNEFSVFIYGHEETAKKKVELFLKSIKK